MSRVKAVAWGVLVCGVCTSTVHGDTISSSDGNSWIFFSPTGNSSLLNASPDSSGTSAPLASGTTMSTPVFTAASASSSTSVFSSPTASSSATSNSLPVFASSASTASAGGSTTPAADAYLNFGGSSYLESSMLTTGTIQPWYTSPSVTKFFGGASPNTQQQASFENQVLQDVQQTFASSNLFPKLTLDPNAPANHTISIISGASYGPNPNAIGITDVGHNGFDFIDKFSAASSLTDLETAVAKNVSHELMHAFGVGIHPDQTGNYIDAGTASWSLLTNPNSMFSPAAASLIAATGFGQNVSSSSTSAQLIDGQQEILAAPVPEPATVTIWVVGLAGIAAFGRRRLALAA